MSYAQALRKSVNNQTILHNHSDSKACRPFIENHAANTHVSRYSIHKPAGVIDKIHKYQPKHDPL